MSQGEATDTPLGEHDYRVKSPFTGFRIPDNAPARFTLGEVIPETGTNETDVRFRRRDQYPEFHVRRDDFQKAVFPKTSK